MRMRRFATAVAMLAMTSACEEDNPFRNQPPEVTGGESQVWELSLPAFPSGWDFRLGRRLFIGSTEIGRSIGAWVLDANVDGALVFVPFSEIAPDLTTLRTGIADLGPVAFESIAEVPSQGYAADSSGVRVFEGHVYAFRMTDLGVGASPVNYAKLEVTEIGQEFAGDPRSRFIRFQWAYQEQPLNLRVVE